MIVPLKTSAPAAWLADHGSRSNDLRVSSLLPPYPEYVRFDNRRDEPSLIGLIDNEVLAAVLPLLSVATATPEHCYLAVWTGYPLDAVDAIIEVRDHRYALFGGTISDAVAVDGIAQTPNYWWPEDRAWCVLSHIDLPVSLVGCSADTAAAVEAALGQGAARLRPDADVVARDRLDTW